MVMTYGMSDKVGHISIKGNELGALSPAMRAIIDSEVKALLEVRPGV